MISDAAEAWVQKGVSGELLGTFPYTPIEGGLAEVEVYWINDPDLVGLRYPDNSRLAPGQGYLHHRDPRMQEKFATMRKQWMQLHDTDRFKKEYGPKLNIGGVKIGGSQKLVIGKKKLVFGNQAPPEQEKKPLVFSKKTGLLLKKKQ